MISSIGNKKGFTFFELMVTVAILSTGITLIYRSFLISLDYQEYLSHRLYAINLLNDAIAIRQWELQDKGKVDLGQHMETVDAKLNNKKVAFQISTLVRKVDQLENIFELDTVLAWLENGRSVRLVQSTYISR